MISKHIPEHFYTLVTCVGIGMYKDGYQDTTYRFPDGRTCRTRFFIQALLNLSYRKFKKLILVGTVTSLWDAFIDENNPANTELWMGIRAQCEAKGQGISSENVTKLEQYISERYGIPCRIFAHTQKIDADTTEDLFTTYMAVASEIAAGTRVLFDITHGFRSIPLLMFQALQFSSTSLLPQQVELVYGEYIKQEEISYVRDLSSYWDYSEMTFAVYLFKSRFDGMLLAEKIEPYWKAGSLCIQRLSMMVACNYALQIDQMISQIQSALNMPEVPVVPDWIRSVREFLFSILKTVNGATKGHRLFSFSQLLEQHGLYIQALLTLQTAVETAVTEKFGTDQYIGDFDWWKKYGQPEYENVKKELSPNERIALYNLETVRNKAAHAGGRDKYSKEFPSAKDIIATLQKGKPAARRLFTLLESL